MMKLAMEAGLGPGHIVLDGDPALLPQRGTALPQFSADAEIECDVFQQLAYSGNNSSNTGDKLLLTKHSVQLDFCQLGCSTRWEFIVLLQTLEHRFRD